jgi:hypothetical protein
MPSGHKSPPEELKDSGRVRIGDQVNEAGRPLNPDERWRPYKKPAPFDPPRADDYYPGGFAGGDENTGGDATTER